MDSRASGSGVAAWLSVGGFLLFLFLPVVAGGESFFGRDVTPFFYPMKRYLADAVADGRLLPLWNPLVSGGEPFFASLQPGVLYPGSLVLHLLPFPHGVDWLIILHFGFAGMGWILLLRRLGHSNAAATLGALAFTLGGFFVSLGNYVNNLQTMSWAPWLFLAWQAWLRAPRSDRLAGFALVCVAAFLGGEPQLLALVLLIVFARGLLPGGPEGMSPARQALGFAIGGGLALLLAGVQLVPFIEFIGESVRTLPLDLSFSSGRSQEPAGLLHLFLPPVLGAGEQGFTTEYLAAARVPWLLSLYPGLIVGVLGWVGWRMIGTAERRFWLALGVVGLLLALGAHTPVYRLAFEGIPPLRALRYPEKFAAAFALGWPFLAAAGLDGLRRQGRPGSGVVGMTLGLGVACGVVALVGWTAVGWVASAVAGACARHGEALLLCADPQTAVELYGEVALRLALLLGATGLVLALARRRVLRPAVAAWILVGLAGLDLLVAHRPVNPSVESGVYTTRAWAADALAPRLDRRDEYRFRGTPVSAAMGEAARVRGALDLSNIYLDLQAMGPNAGQMFGVAQQGGLQGVELTSVAMTHEAAIHGWAQDPVRFLRRMNVRFYADPTAGTASMHGLTEVARHPELPIRLWEVAEPLPRAFIAEGWEQAPDAAAALRRALQPDVSARLAVLETAPRDASRAPGTAPGRLVAATWTPERVRLISHSAEPAVLVLMDRWYPGWRVTVNGEPADLLRANGVFRAVEIPSGQADVEFELVPGSLRLGALSSLLGAALAAALLLHGRRREAS